MTKRSLHIKDDIYLRPISFVYAHDMTRAMKDQSISDHALTIPFPYTLDDALKFIQGVKDFERKLGVQQEWSIVARDTCIGGIGLMWNYGPKSHNSEIGYWISKDYRNRGIMTMVVNQFSAMIFQNSSLVRLEAQVFSFNKASIKVLKKAGFEKEGYGAKKYHKQGEFLDAYLFSRCK